MGKKVLKWMAVCLILALGLYLIYCIASGQVPDHAQTLSEMMRLAAEQKGESISEDRIIEAKRRLMTAFKVMAAMYAVTGLGLLIAHILQIRKH